MSTATLPETTVTTKPKTKEQTATRRMPPYNVVLLNDEDHSVEFVEDVLRKVLGCTREKATLLTLQADVTGRAIIWTGPREAAELKADQVRTFHEIREPSGKNLGPLGCEVEPAPGA